MSESAHFNGESWCFYTGFAQMNRHADDQDHLRIESVQWRPSARGSPPTASLLRSKRSRHIRCVSVDTDLFPEMSQAMTTPPPGSPEERLVGALDAPTGPAEPTGTLEPKRSTHRRAPRVCLTFSVANGLPELVCGPEHMRRVALRELTEHHGERSPAVPMQANFTSKTCSGLRLRRRD